MMLSSIATAHTLFLRQKETSKDDSLFNEKEYAESTFHARGRAILSARKLHESVSELETELGRVKFDQGGF
jgi:hypothetical protein